MGWMSTDSKTRYATGQPTLEESFEAERSEREEDQKLWGSGAAERALKAGIESARNKVAMYTAELNNPRAYNQGGAVYKHDHPTYVKFGKTGDSSLLAKGRK